MTEIPAEVQDKFVELAVRFHMETGASISAIQQFMGEVLKLNAELTNQILEEEMDKFRANFLAEFTQSNRKQ